MQITVVAVVSLCSAVEDPDLAAAAERPPDA